MDGLADGASQLGRQFGWLWSRGPVPRKSHSGARLSSGARPGVPAVVLGAQGRRFVHRTPTGIPDGPAWSQGPRDREAGAPELAHTCHHARRGRQVASGAEAEALHAVRVTVGVEVVEVHRAEWDRVPREAHDIRCLDHPLHRGLGRVVTLDQNEALLRCEVVQGKGPPAWRHFENGHRDAIAHVDREADLDGARGQVFPPGKDLGRTGQERHPAPATLSGCGCSAR